MSLVASIITGGSNSHQTTSEEANALATDIISAGVIGTLTNTNGAAPATGGFAVNAQGTPDATVAVSTGVCYVTATPTGGSSQKVRVKNNASANVTISANASGSTKYDWLYVKIDPDKALNPNVSATDVATLTTSRSSSQTTDNGTPPTYGSLIAVITVANGFSTITNGNITDSRAQASISSVATVSAGWTSLGSTPATVTANGNRNYTCVFNSTDLTGTLSAGMRLLLTRTTAAPTQCTSLNGSTQFYSKTSPAGMTFTDDFTVSAWVKISSTTTQGTIISRYNGTSGWDFNIGTTGQVNLTGFNAGAANFSQVTSNQSVPLNKWVHIAATLDMSSFTNSAVTSYVMIDGVDAPAIVSRGGTNPTALIQAGNLEIGSRNSGLNPFNGKIAQAAIYNAKLSQGSISNTMSQAMAGTESGLTSAYSFNNSINDLNANANNLTANGSAVATNADSPFAQGATAGSLEYGIIVAKPTFSTNTTVVVQVPEGSAIPTSGAASGISAVSYSTQGVPYNFPKQRGKWVVDSLIMSFTALNVTVSVWANPNAAQLNVPIGEWMLSYQTSLGQNTTVAAGTAFYASLSTANNSNTDTTFQSYHLNNVATSGAYVSVPMFKQNPLSLSAATVYYFVAEAISGAGTTSLSLQAALTIRAECAYL